MHEALHCGNTAEFTSGIVTEGSNYIRDAKVTFFDRGTILASLFLMQFKGWKVAICRLLYPSRRLSRDFKQACTKVMLYVPWNVADGSGWFSASTADNVGNPHPYSELFLISRKCRRQMATPSANRAVTKSIVSMFSSDVTPYMGCA